MPGTSTGKWILSAKNGYKTKQLFVAGLNFLLYFVNIVKCVKTKLVYNEILFQNEKCHCPDERNNIDNYTFYRGNLSKKGILFWYFLITFSKILIYNRVKILSKSM